MKHKRYAVGLVGLALAGPLAGCGDDSSSGSSGGGAGSDYVVGFSADLSSFTAAYGKPQVAVVKAVFDRVNADGGVNGHKLVLKSVDNKATTEGAVAAARQLVASKPVFMFASQDSNVCAQTYSVTGPAKIPIACPYVPTEKLDPPQPYIFAEDAPKAWQVPRLLSHLADSQGDPLAIAMLLPDAVGIKEWGAAVQAHVGDVGGKVTTSQSIPLTDLSNVGAQAAAILGSKPNVVLTDTTPAGLAALQSALREGGYDGPIYSFSPDYHSLVTLKDPQLFSLFNVAVVPDNATDPGAKQYIADAKAAGVEGTEALNSLQITDAWLQAMQLVESLNSCKDSCTGESVAKSMPQTSVDEQGVSLPPGYGYSADMHYAHTSSTFYGYSQDTSDVAKVFDFKVAQGS